MKSLLYRKTIIFVSLFYLILTLTSMILSVYFIRNTEERVVRETAVYIKNFLIHLETSDYSFSAEIIKELNNKGQKESSDEASEIISTYYVNNKEDFNDRLYRKNLRNFFESAADNSMYLVSADLYTTNGNEASSLLYENKNITLSSNEQTQISENKKVLDLIKSGAVYTEIVDNFRYIDTGEKTPVRTRFIRFEFNFTEISADIIKKTAVFLIVVFISIIIFFIYLLPEIKFSFKGKLENIDNSLKEILKGNRDVRIYLPDEDVLTGISSSLNKILDDSERKESELYFEKDKFNLFFENIPLGAVILDAEGKLVYENRIIKSLFNGDYEPFPGVFYSVLNRGDSDLLFENLSYVLSGEKKGYKHRCRLYRGAFRHQFFEIDINSIIKNNAVKFVVITFIDLSSGAVRDNTNIDFFKINGMSKLAGTISNGLNNIHHIINGYVEYLLLGGIDEEEFRDVIKNMIDAIRRASVLTRHLKIFSRENSVSESVLVNIKELIGDLDTILKEIFHSGISFQLSDDGSNPECFGDESQIEQVIINLCINASDAIEGEGHVEITAGTAEYTESDVLGYPEAEAGKYIYISISDTGMGIPEDQIRKIFEPFYSTGKNAEAPGMGLSLSYSIVMNHKGFINVSSEIGKGSLFTVNIPVAQGPKDTVLTEAGKITAVKDNNSEKTILFVDDEELILSLGKIMLEKAGYNVLTASGGLEAVEYVKNHKDEIDLVICDLVMPDVSGRETVEMIHKLKPDLQVLYISGFAEKELDKTDKHEILGKPFKSRELISRISDILG